jgi:signal transduction histidine kinase
MTADHSRGGRMGPALHSVLWAIVDALRQRPVLASIPAPSAGRGVGALELVAHELRTPLALMRGYLSLMEDGTYPVPQRTRDGAVAIVAAKARELDGLIDVLNLATKLADGRLPVVARQFDVAEAVEAAMAEVADRARLELAKVEVRLAGYPLLVTADRGHVVRILVNLLNNALSYSSRPASVTVAVRRREGAEVFVSDRGAGIPANRQREVFERFNRIADAGETVTPGLGLGLPLSRELAMLNGGSLALDHSEPGQGSVFVLRLPVRGQ